MRATLQQWITDAGTLEAVRAFGLDNQMTEFGYVEERSSDLYVSLLGELFDALREGPEDSRDWAALGNAFAQIAEILTDPKRSDTWLYSAASFYNGGFSAAAQLTMRQASPEEWFDENYRACFDLLARSGVPTSTSVLSLLELLREGSIEGIANRSVEAYESAKLALDVGPEEWVASYLYAGLLRRFEKVNLRAVLPNGDSDLWNPLIASFLERTPPVWDFFPSQIEAIDGGLLDSDSTYSLQMPTGSGKTALTETLIFTHLQSRPSDIAVLLVPYRALARELRATLARRLSGVGLSTRTIYGGTVPTAAETQELDNVRVIIATPEALTGLLGQAPQLVSRVTLLVCDEGHLLDQGERGTGLEMLLTRFRSRTPTPPRTVFISAIVPNIEEINSWLGGFPDTVIRSTFRPVESEFALLRSRGTGRRTVVELAIQPSATNLSGYLLPNFLSSRDFEFVNTRTNNVNTFGFDSLKSQAIAAARKSLGLGAVAVFAATKTGDQGVVGLAEELIRQIDSGTPLPSPVQYISNPEVIADIADYLEVEYGEGWIGTRALKLGCVVHHGDVPQESREALEDLLTKNVVRLVLCTSTLAEGVNLPIRTLILYSVHRRHRSGSAQPMLARDIRNLVGRAGRAGITTRGLVICVNERQWPLVQSVATGEPGEDVHGALLALVRSLQLLLLNSGVVLSNEVLESNLTLFSAVDGIDSMLVELLHDDLSDDDFAALATELAQTTFAARQLALEGQEVLTMTFSLRAHRIAELRQSGRLSWIRETGTKVRLLDSVVEDLATRPVDWEGVSSPLDVDFVDSVMGWALGHQEMADALKDDLRADETPSLETLTSIVSSWISGSSMLAGSAELEIDVDTLLRVHGRSINYVLMTLVEQGLAILTRQLAEVGQVPAPSVLAFAEHLRFGVPTVAARSLMISGVRHRRAAVALGNHPAMTSPENLFVPTVDIARRLLEEEDRWRGELGSFVYERTVHDVALQ
jgi:helicase